ncbi:LOW QUALITY PROTEIN: cytochrome P450 4g15-like [Leguminivora glycinivorella]|uniref:LOW QUALITY PROTEIN: cytochrome P450 4g15-like n=1 Tax=Leguminivora glycinivorella TaxID=1035111 RepID=UPI00200E1DCD|nr:LOW QUALITY PROTEIN: cytochrome P450 4g15-like [Leguminivora glycinivorella]
MLNSMHRAVAWGGSVLVLATLLLWVIWRVRNRRLLALAARVPGPPALPLLGNALIFMAKPNEQLKLLADMLSKYGEYVRFWLGPELNIVVSNPEDIKLILTSNKVTKKGPVYNFMKPMIGTGILTGGEHWRHSRKTVTPSYNKKAVAAFARVFNAEAAALARRLCARDANTFDVFHDVVNATTQCVCQTLMGLTKKESLNLANLDYVVSNTRRLYSLFFSKMTKWWLQIPLIYWIIGAQKSEDTFIKEFHVLTKDIVDKRKALARIEGIKEEVRGIVDRLILSGDFTDQEIRNQTFALFTTSQEAGAKIVSAVLMYLAHLPEWQDRVYNEILERLGPDDEFITDEHIKSLQYLDMVYKEVLRCMSIAAMIQRTVEEEITINSGKITLPVGTSLAIPIHMLHRNPKYWPDPDKVDPGRFLPENVAMRDPNAFVPYSLGPMDCLGRVYAIQMVKTMVVCTLRHVRLEADGRLEDLPLDVAISVSFSDGYNLRVSPRRQRNMDRNLA